MATLHDVAKRAGVSVSAVSRVLSNSPSARVSEPTRLRIHDAAQTLGYRPNYAGRALKLARSSVLALIVPDVTNAIFSELMDGVEEAALENDYVMLLGRSEKMQPGGGTIERLIGEGRVDAILIQPGDGVPISLDSLENIKAPVVLLNSVDGNLPGAVTLPDAEATRMATDHLLSLGHRRIALAGGLAASATAVRREEGFRDAMRQAGITVIEERVTRFGYTPEAGVEALRTLWALEHRPTAVVFANVNAAIGALRLARQSGVSIPGELSVIAIHDSWTAETAFPSLTTVRMPLRELGRTAVESAVRRLRHDPEANLPLVVDTPPAIVARESVAPPA